MGLCASGAGGTASVPPNSGDKYRTEEPARESEHNDASAAHAAAEKSDQNLKVAWTDIKKGSVWSYYNKVKTLGEGMTGAVYQLSNKQTGDM